MKFLALCIVIMLSTVQICEAGKAVRYATVPSDIQAFRDKHKEDSAFIFFVDLSESNSGLLDGLFNLFLDSSSEYEVDLEESLAQNHPTMKIDLSKTSLKPAKEEYHVESVPYLISYHKGVEIFRGEPDLDTADAIDKIIKERNNKLITKVENVQTVHPDRNGTNLVPNDAKKTTDIHHHPKPLTVIPDYGHISTSDQPTLIVSPQSPVSSLDVKTGANIQAKAEPQNTKSADQLIEFKQTFSPAIVSQPNAQASNTPLATQAYPSYRASAPPQVQARAGVQSKIGERFPRVNVSSLIQGRSRRNRY